LPGQRGRAGSARPGPGRAREQEGRHRLILTAQQQFRGSAGEPIDGERPAGGEVAGDAEEQAALVKRLNGSHDSSEPPSGSSLAVTVSGGLVPSHRCHIQYRVLSRYPGGTG
jgi:hypothetical protein